MSLEFYLFDVDHGQSAAVHLPNGRWCLFDAGGTSTFSPTRYINQKELQKRARLAALLPSVSVPRPYINPFAGLVAQPVQPTQASAARTYLDALFQPPVPAITFRYLKATISHFHGDHLTDYETMLQASPEFMNTVICDRDYLIDVRDTSGTDSWNRVATFVQRFSSGFGTATMVPNYGGAQITELSLSVAEARSLGGSPNSRVNNASVVTRIDCYGNSILICGDLETEGWEYAFMRSPHWAAWRALVSGIDILVAPHHGHSSAYSASLLALARPKAVLISVVSGDEHVDNRYSGEAVSGITVNNQIYKRMTTRNHEHIKVTIDPPVAPNGKGKRIWSNL